MNKEKLNIDLAEEVKSITDELMNIANYLVTPEDKNKDKKNNDNENQGPDDGNSSNSDSDESENGDGQENNSSKSKSEKKSKNKDSQDLDDSDDEDSEDDNDGENSDKKSSKDKKKSKNNSSDDGEDEDNENEGDDDKDSSKSNKGNKNKQENSDEDYDENNEDIDPRQELKDALKELNDLLNSKDSSKNGEESDNSDKSQNQNSKDGKGNSDDENDFEDDWGDEDDFDDEDSDDENNSDSSDNGEEKDSDSSSQNGQDEGNNSNESGGSDGEGNNSNSNTPMNNNGEMQDYSSNAPFNFRGITIDPSKAQDVKISTEDENKTERQLDTELLLMARQAAAEARSCGKGSGRMLTLWEQMIKPDPPKWVNLMNPYLRPDNNVQWLYNKAHKNRLTIANGGKLLFRGAVRPKEKLKDLCIALDNSGSINQEDFDKFYNTVAGFLQIRKNVRGWVCWWDTEIAGWDDEHNKPIANVPHGFGEFTDYPSFKKVKNIGGGGTDPECALRFAKAHDCKYVIIFTDGEFTVPDRRWEYQFTKILWVICNKKEYDRFEPTWGIKCL